MKIDLTEWTLLESEVELVELNGRKYRKEDLENALDALTPVE